MPADEYMKSPTDASPRRRLRFRGWPLLLLFLAALAALVWIWGFTAGDRQARLLRSTYVLFAGGFLGLAWLLFFSRLPWRWRLGAAASIAGLVLLAASLFRIQGVTGDLLPILEWRFRSTAPVEPPLSVPSPAALHPNLAGPDYPQFQGPARNAMLPGPNLARDWGQTPPRTLWRHPVGAAWSGFAVKGQYAITQEQAGESEQVVCYHLTSGALVWSHSDRARYDTTIAGEGPRATPSIVRDRVFSLGATGRLNCLDLASGKPLWSRNIIQENNSRVPDWGLSGSPLVVSNLVIVSAGGPDSRSLVAYHQQSGQWVWGGGTEGASYSSPCLATLGNRDQVLIFNNHHLAAHDLASGAVLWEFPWKRGHPHIALPLLLGQDQVVISSGYGTGSALLQIEQDSGGNWSARQVWRSIRLKSKFANMILKEGHIYGLDDGMLVCLEAASGKLLWKGARYGHGQMILAGSLLLIMGERGDLVLVEPVPEEPRELSRHPIFTEKTWNPPALAGSLLLVRNDQEAVCLELPLMHDQKPQEP